MPRLMESERTATVTTHVNHWKEADALAGGTLNLDSGYGCKNLEADWARYQAKTEEIRKMAEVQLPQLRVERDALFGVTSQDPQGCWFFLAHYKPTVISRLLRLHPLSKTIPNLGLVRNYRYLDIIKNFSDHWSLVNQALSPDLVIGSLTLAQLQATENKLKTIINKIQNLERVQLPLDRAEREQIFGDVPEEDREETSIIARLQHYQVTVKTRWPGQPISTTLPRIFPEATKASLPTFPYNWITHEENQVQTWFTPPTLSDVFWVYLEEGNFAESVPFVSPAEGAVWSHLWNNVVVVGELDLFELRDREGRTLARGKRNPSLPQPAL